MARGVVLVVLFVFGCRGFLLSHRLSRGTCRGTALGGQVEALVFVLVRLLRRGATVAMIRLFRMTWDSSRGLVARTRESDIYLGWNIELEDDDETGEEYMEGILNDIDYRPERWEVFTAPNGRLSAIKLMREDIAGTLEHAREIYNERRFNSSR